MDDTELKSFDTLNIEIDKFLKRLDRKGLCPCCVATGMMYRGAFLHESATDREQTIELCEDIVDTLNADDEAGTRH